MLNTKRTFTDRITLQKVGSRQREEINFFAKAEINLSDKEDKAERKKIMNKNIRRMRRADGKN